MTFTRSAKQLISRYCPSCKLWSHHEILLVDNKLVYHCRPCAHNEKLPEEFQFSSDRTYYYPMPIHNPRTDTPPMLSYDQFTYLILAEFYHWRDNPVLHVLAESRDMLKRWLDAEKDKPENLNRAYPMRVDAVAVRSFSTINDVLDFARFLQDELDV